MVFSREQLQAATANAAVAGPVHAMPPTETMATWADTEAIKIAHICWIAAHRGEDKKRFKVDFLLD